MAASTIVKKSRVKPDEDGCKRPPIAMAAPCVESSSLRKKYIVTLCLSNYGDKYEWLTDYIKVMRERSGSSKRTGDSDHKEVLTFTVRSDEEHVRSLTKHAVNNMANSSELSAHPYVRSNLFIVLHAKKDLHNTLLDSISAGEEMRDRFMPGGFESGETCSFYCPIYMFHADGTM